MLVFGIDATGRQHLAPDPAVVVAVPYHKNRVMGKCIRCVWTKKFSRLPIFISKTRKKKLVLGLDSPSVCLNLCVCVFVCFCVFVCLCVYVFVLRFVCVFKIKLCVCLSFDLCLCLRCVFAWPPYPSSECGQINWPTPSLVN